MKNLSHSLRLREGNNQNQNAGADEEDDDGGSDTSFGEEIAGIENCNADLQDFENAEVSEEEEDAPGPVDSVHDSEELSLMDSEEVACDDKSFCEEYHNDEDHEYVARLEDEF